MSEKNPSVDFFFAKAKKWQEEFAQLRTIIPASGAERRIEVGMPVLHVGGPQHSFEEKCAPQILKGNLSLPDISMEE